MLSSRMRTGLVRTSFKSSHTIYAILLRGPLVPSVFVLLHIMLISSVKGADRTFREFSRVKALWPSRKANGSGTSMLILRRRCSIFRRRRLHAVFTRKAWTHAHNSDCGFTYSRE